MIGISKMRLMSIILCLLMTATTFQFNLTAVYAGTEPAVNTGTGPAINLTTEPAIDTATEPAIDTATEPAIDTATEPAIDTATEPAIDTATEPAVEIAAEPTSAAPTINSSAYGTYVSHPWITSANIGTGGAPNKVHAYFTVDGTDPTEESTEMTVLSYYGMAFAMFPQDSPLPTTLALLKVVVYLDGEEGQDPQISAVASTVINLNAPKPSKSSGLYETSDLSPGISFSGIGAGATVYYETGNSPYSIADGTADTSAVPVPGTGSAIYNGDPVAVTGTDETTCFIIKAAAQFTAGGKDYWSNVVTVYYRSSDTIPRLSADNIDEVISALSLDEKIALTSGIGGDPTTLINGKNIPDEIGFSTAPDRYELGKTVQGGGPAGGTLAIPRFNIPAMVLADGPAGVRMWKNATVWMAPAGLGSTWNADIAGSVGARVAEEAKYYAVDIVLGPGLNTQRNPLAGRNFEYYSEDPYISGYNAAAYVKAIQKGGVGVSLKHFAANDSESNRGQGDVVVSERALREIYLRGFEMAAAEEPWTYMAAYNKINGTLAASNKWLMTDVLRGDWGFDGFVMSDWGADYVPSASLEAQMDLGESSRNTSAVYNWINAAGISSEEKTRRIELLNRSVKNILGIIVKSSAFNGVYGELQPDGTYSDLTQEEVSQRSNTWAISSVRADSAVINKQAADEAIVMLKNAGEALPLEKGTKLALVTSHLAWNEKFHGRWYNNSASVGDIVIQGTGSAQVRFNHGIYYSPNLEDALKNRGFDVVDHRVDSKMDITYEELKALDKRIGDPLPPQPGQIESLPVTTDIENTQEAAVAAAAEADVGVFVLTRVSGEGADLAPADFNLTEREKMIFEAYANAFHAQGKKIVVLLNVGGTVNTTEFRADADAILDVWNPGTEGTVAIADILRGVVNPSGKLAQTFPQTYADSPSIAMAKTGHEGKTFNSMPTVYYDDGVYVGYRYYETNPEKYATMVAYPFGYGLSYTTFEFSDLTLDKTSFINDNDTVTAKVKVTNTGNVAGKEVVQLYLSAGTWEAENRPKQELKAYGKTSLLEPGQSEIVSLTLKLRDLQYFDDDNPDNDLTNVAYGNGDGWTVKDNTVFTVTVRNNAEAAAAPNVPIAGLTQTFTYKPTSSTQPTSGSHGGGGGGGGSVTTAGTLEWNVTSASGIDVTLSKNTGQLGSGLIEKLKKIIALNAELSKDVYDLAIKVDGKTIDQALAPIKITVNVSSLTDAQKAGLTGVYYTDLNNYKQLGGELSEDKKTFVFYTYHTGRHGIIFTDKLLKIQFAIDDKNYSKDGVPCTNDVAPFLSTENRTMIPVRVVAEALGAEVEWTDETKTATVTMDGKAVTIAIGQSLPDGLGTAVIVSDRTFVPLRYVLETLGANVVWDGAKRTVNIYQ